MAIITTASFPCGHHAFSPRRHRAFILLATTPSPYQQPYPTGARAITPHTCTKPSASSSSSLCREQFRCPPSSTTGSAEVPAACEANIFNTQANATTHGRRHRRQQEGTHLPCSSRLRSPPMLRSLPRTSPTSYSRVQRHPHLGRTA